MSDHCEEQEMEAEALAAIFDTAFETISDTQPFQWSVKLVPVDCGGDEEEENRENHVGVKLLATIPLDYPESLPTLDLEILKGLAEEQRQEILEIGRSEAEANEGMPLIFVVCEAIRSWLADNNVKGLDDASMHAQMMRRAKEAERSKCYTHARSRSRHEYLPSRKRRQGVFHGPGMGVCFGSIFGDNPNVCPLFPKTCHIKSSAIRTHGQDPVMIIFLLESADKAFFTDLAWWDNNCRNIYSIHDDTMY
eukprot:scaffold421188_cov47-Attheya_sp.AAC.6